MKIFGEELKKLRLSKGLSTEELGRRSGMHSAAIWRLESAYKCPTVKTLKKLAKGLGVELNSLLKLTGVFDDKK